MNTVDQAIVDGWKDVGIDYLEKRLRTSTVTIRDYPYSRFHAEWKHVADLLRAEIKARQTVEAQAS